MQSLGSKAYYPPCATNTSENRMVAMYHNGTSPSIQEVVLASLKDPNGKVRIIIATTALGMGVDIKGLHRIISYGPPVILNCLIKALLVVTISQGKKQLCCDICELVCTCETINCPDILDSMNSLKTRSTGNTNSGLFLFIKNRG